ncbi:MAG: hypothetical protein IJ807_03180, partial [Eubacterium sp.]|nr:hypothetical protein [Eubacterium sp.]
TIETVPNTQEVGAIGTALVVAAGINDVDVNELAGRLIRVEHTYTPDPKYREVYDRNYEVFKKLYNANKKLFRKLNS